jgi:dTDP-glucose pyrophosphorylase
MQDRTYHRNIIPESYSIKQAMQCLNDMEGKDNLTLFVTNASNQLVGTLTDGDIRRGLLKGKDISDSVGTVMHPKFRFLLQNHFGLDEIDRFRNDEIELVPLLDSNRQIIRIIALSEKKSILPLDVFMLAGGEGRRLRPLTDDLPKPLLKVGDKPIIDHNIERLRCYGIDNILLSVNYLAEKIEHHLAGYPADDINFTFIREKKPLGTIGSLALAQGITHDTVLVMNSDLLTNIDFEDFYRSFISSGADMAVAGVPYKVDVPYAIMEVEGEKVTSFREKPTYTYYSNGGIYLLKRKLIDLIPKNEFYNATDLMEKIMLEKYKLTYYPILGYWMDIGQHADYLKAQEDIRHIRL